MPTPIPSWGRVVARPNEFLIQIRSGRVVRSGQGLSCFKWPWDSVSVLPTTLAKLAFVADQVTLEKVGVQVSGLAVYRIAEPLLAYRMIDGGNVAIVGDVLREMFVGATRRIVSGLSLEECLTHRKERVATELMREITPVLAGEGMESDGTDRGWGVVLDTIEIQDVRVLSAEVFSRLQAPYRASLQLASMRAEAEVAKEQARLQEAREKEEEESRLRRMQQEEARLMRERQRDEERRQHEQALLAAADHAEHERELRRVQAARERLEIEIATSSARVTSELAEKRAIAEVEAETMRLVRAAQGDLSPARLEEILLTETMPRLAEAYRGAFDRIHLTEVQTASGGDRLPEAYGLVTSAIEQIMGAARGNAVKAPRAG
jgi:hypothetical protein